MNIEIYQVDAFASELFKGNPAAVCPLNEWLPDNIMQSIAFENNLSETAFYIKKGNDFEIRWFTPTTEVDLCGHATLATAYVIFEIKRHTSNQITLGSKSGDLVVRRNQDTLTLDFPKANYIEIPLTEELKAPFRATPKSAYKDESNNFIMLVFDETIDIKNLDFDLQKIAQIENCSVIVTSPGKNEDCDFVSRFFGPQSGIDEDPVTGSAHTLLTPYWAKALNKKTLFAKQLSQRGGELTCELINDRVFISGKAKLYLSGEIFI